MSIQLTLERDGHDQPWGFRLQGGVDVGLPLSVLRVLVGTPSESVLKKGDVVTKISQTGTHNLTHQQAVDLFNTAGNQIQVTIKRSGSSSAPGASSQPTVSALQATAAIRQQQQQQHQHPVVLQRSASGCESPQVAALPRTTFVLKSDLPPVSAAPTTGGADDLSVTHQPYRTLPLVQPSAKILNELGAGSYSHLRLQEEICTGVREPQLVPVTPAQVNAIKANEFLMKQKVRSRSPDPSVSIRSLLRPTPVNRGRPAWKDQVSIVVTGRNIFRIGGQMVALKPAVSRIIPGAPLRSVGVFKPKPLLSPAMWRTMLKTTPIKPLPPVKKLKPKRVPLPEIKLRKELVTRLATRDILKEYCNQEANEGVRTRKGRTKSLKPKIHDGVDGPATVSRTEVLFCPAKRQIRVTISIRRFEEYEDFFTVGDKTRLPPGPCASFTFTLDYLKNGLNKDAFRTVPVKSFESMDVAETVNITASYEPEID